MIRASFATGWYPSLAAITGLVGDHGAVERRHHERSIWPAMGDAGVPGGPAGHVVRTACKLPQLSGAVTGPRAGAGAA
jgi:hypothetical protein